eukprot:COSAG01_NODE_1966_length_8778_cov_41.983176_5_plen_80_part_00
MHEQTKRLQHTRLDRPSLPVEQVLEHQLDHPRHIKCAPSVLGVQSQQHAAGQRRLGPEHHDCACTCQLGGAFVSQLSAG